MPAPRSRRWPGGSPAGPSSSAGSPSAPRWPFASGAAEPRARALFALGFPFRLMPDVGFLAGVRTPRLFVQGENDQFGGGEKIRALVEPLPEPKKLVVIPGSDHFFNGHLEALQSEVASWAGARPWVAA